MRLLSLAATLLALANALSAGGVLRLGRITDRLSEQDLNTISALCRMEGKEPWLIDGDTSQVLPETWLIDAYLEPDLTASTLRRGRVVSLKSRAVDGKATEWRQRIGVQSYAQVTVDSKPFSATLTDSSLDRPFIVEEEFGAEELISVVRFLRSGPEVPNRKLPDGWTHLLMPVDTSKPITHVRRNEDTVVVTLQDDKRSGQTVTLRRVGPQWTVVDSIVWVA